MELLLIPFKISRLSLQKIVRFFILHSDHFLNFKIVLFHNPIGSYAIFIFYRGLYLKDSSNRIFSI